MATPTESGLTISEDRLRAAYREALSELAAAWRQISEKRAELDEEERAAYRIEDRVRELGRRVEALGPAATTEQEG